LPYENKAQGTPCTEGGGSYCDANGRCVQCNVADDCEPGGECTVTACAAGACDTQTAQDGTSCDHSAPGDGTCTGGTCGPTTCVPVCVDLDEDDCTEPICLATECSTQPRPEHSDCDEDGGSYCDADGNCVQCTALAHCTDGEECTDDYCTVANMCVNAPKDDGEPCSQGVCLSGVCGNVFPCTEQGILDAIARGGGPYTFACNGPTTVVTLAEIVIDNDVILDGEGNLTIDGNDDHRVLSVVSGVSVELTSVTVSGGYIKVEYPDHGRGAGMLNEGTLTVRDSVVEWNIGDDWIQGGGIYSNGTLSVVNSVVRHNSITLGEGGGIYSEGTLTLVGSGVSDNWGGADAYWGAGIDSVGTLLLIDSHVTNNRAGDGAGIESVGSLTLINSTVAHGPYWGIVSNGTATITNSTVDGWQDTAISHSGGTLTVVSSTLTAFSSEYGNGTIGIGSDAQMIVANSLIIEARDYATGATCNGSVISLGGNIESPTNDCGFAEPTDLAGVTAEDLKLGPLADNGGPTMTFALLPGSVAIDRVPPAMCVDADGEPLTTDQRGVTRPQGSACDVGAFEYADCTGSTCDDGNECTADHCDPLDTAWCANVPVVDGTACDFGGVAGLCVAGECLEAVWGAPVVIGAGNTPLHLAVDPEGNVTAIWQQSYGTSSSIWSNRHSFGAGWGTPARLMTLTDRVSNLGVAIDPDGNVTAVWGAYDGSQDNIWSKRYTPSGGEETAVLIETGTGRALGPQVAVDPSGNVTAIWQQFDGASYSIWSNRYTPSGGWGAPELVETGTEYAADGRLAVDPSGVVTAIWQQNVRNDGVSDRIWSNRYTPSGGWGTAVPIEANLGNLSDLEVAVDFNGNATAVWSRAPTASSPRVGDLWSNRYTPSGGWGTAVPIETNLRDASNPQLATNSQGRAVAVWVQADNIWSNQYTPNVGWGTAMLIETGTGRALGPQVAVDPSGNVTATWQQHDGASHSIWSNRRTPSGGWGTAVPIGIGYNPKVASDLNGNVTAIWGRYDGASYSIWSSRFE